MPARPDTRPEWQRLADDPQHPLRHLGLEPRDPDLAAAQSAPRWFYRAEAWMALAVAGLAVGLLVVVLLVQPWRHLADEIAGIPYNVWRLTHPDTWGQR